MDEPRPSRNVSCIERCREIPQAALLEPGALRRFSPAVKQPPGSIIILCGSRHQSHFRPNSWTGLTGWTLTGPPSWSGLPGAILLAWNNPNGNRRDIAIINRHARRLKTRTVLLHNRERPFIQRIKGRMLRPQLNRCGYIYIVLSKDGIAKAHVVHRLVAKAFLGDHQDRPHGNNKDGVKSNNVIGNLEWVTPFGD